MKKNNILLIGLISLSVIFINCKQEKVDAEGNAQIENAEANKETVSPPIEENIDIEKVEKELKAELASNEPIENPDSKPDCDDRLLLFEDGVQLLLNLGEQRNAGDKSDETLDKIKRMHNNLKDLGMTLQKEAGAQWGQDCGKIWLVSFTKYAEYIRANSGEIDF